MAMWGAFSVTVVIVVIAPLQPTLCHYFIRLLKEKGLLLRCYTQVGGPWASWEEEGGCLRPGASVVRAQALPLCLVTGLW